MFLLAVILGTVALIATGRGGELGDAEPDRPPYPRLPKDRLVEPVDVNRLRFPLAFRGYRMGEVDQVLDRLAGELAERDRQVDALGQELLGGVSLDDGASLGGGTPFDQAVGGPTDDEPAGTRSDEEAPHSGATSENAYPPDSGHQQEPNLEATAEETSWLHQYRSPDGRQDEPR